MMIEQLVEKAGVLIGMDDVGFGNSCLESLVLIEPEIIKIDKGCVMNIAHYPQKAAALKRLLRITESCNAEIITEGIESKEDLAVLKEMGVEQGQGYYFAKPSRDICTSLRQAS